jgi:hypothetical protein
MPNYVCTKNSNVNIIVLNLRLISDPHTKMAFISSPAAGGTEYS